jgi:hypothetical protein
LCGQSFKDWEVPVEARDLLPQGYQGLKMCVDCYGGVIEHLGHNPMDIPVSRAPWHEREKLWAQSKDAPPNQAHVWFLSWPADQDQPTVDEFMWCTVQDELDENILVIRLENDSFMDRSLRSGQLYRATWDGVSVHSITGRPVFKPVWVSSSPQTPRRNRPAKPSKRQSKAVGKAKREQPAKPTRRRTQVVRK